jgi:hypothetical protein
MAVYVSKARAGQKKSRWMTYLLPIAQYDKDIL